MGFGRRERIWERGDVGGGLLVVLLSRRFCCIVYAMYVVL